MTKELLNAYRRYLQREFDDTDVDVVNNGLGIFCSDYELDDGSYTDLVEVTLYANDDDCEYICDVGGQVVYSERVSYEQAIDELESIGFDDFYNYFGERCFDL